MEQRKSRRVVFERGYDAHMMAIDGTWRRACKVEDISDTARLNHEAQPTKILGFGRSSLRPAAQPTSQKQEACYC